MLSFHSWDLLYLQKTNSMKKTTCKSLVAFVLLSAGICSCNLEKKSTTTEQQAKDTISTPSGLKYFYITKGTGRRIEPGAAFSAQLSLKVNDSVIWTTYEDKDSVFTHIAARGGVIKGYDEMALLLREGDDVFAILPSDIAYGDKGSGVAIPPKSTLVYDRFKIMNVSEPKFVLSDSLVAALTAGGIQKMKLLYDKVRTTKDSLLYHRGMDQMDALWSKLRRKSMFKEAKATFTYFNKIDNDTTFDFYIIRSLELMGDKKAASAKIDEVLKKELSQEQRTYFEEYKLELKKEL